MTQDILKLTTVRSEKIKLDCLKGTNLKDKEFLLQEMNITQNKGYNEILHDGNDDDRFDKLIKYACNAVMIEPTFFKDDEIEKMNGFGKVIMDEIFNKIPTIGMTVKEKKDYQKRLDAFAKKQDDEKLDEVDEEKK